ncbi:hypothetical protein BH18ACI2_BH18ACI2_17550 [soil metagenome]
MPEIVDAFEQDGQFFGVISISNGGEIKKLRFGVSQDGYRALRRVMQLRPFDKMPGLQQRYFFTGSVSGYSDSCKIHVRVEQGKDAGGMLIKAPIELAANLMWFFELKDFSEAAHLPEIK